MLAREKTGQYFRVLALCGLFLLAIPAGDFFLFPENHPPGDDLLVLRVHIFMTLFLGLLVFVVSTWRNIIGHWFSAESQKRIMALEKTEAELSFLKSQVNPHFLFNTLNNIYVLSLRQSGQASESIMKLADLMRYVLTRGGDRYVPLEEEIRYLQHFIDLQRMRLTDRVRVRFEISGTAQGHRVSPLLFLPFIENAFKYGISTRADCQVIIRFILEPGKLIFQTENKVFGGKSDPVKSTGTGLPNVRRRLELLYPGRHWLRAEQTGETFFTDLCIQDMP